MVPVDALVQSVVIDGSHLNGGAKDDGVETGDCVWGRGCLDGGREFGSRSGPYQRGGSICE